MRTICDNSQRGLVMECDSLSDLLAFADQVPSQPSLDRREKRQRDSWSGNVTFDEALDLGRNGWKAGLDQLLDTMATASSQPQPGPSMHMDVAGAYPIAAMAAAGEMECMVNLQPVEDRVRPVVRLAVNTWASAMYGEKQYQVYGAAMVSYVDALEQAGYRVELVHMVHCSTSSGRNSAGKRYTMLTTIKRAEDVLDLDRLSFAFIHPSNLRMVGFQAMMVSAMGSQLSGFCGYPAQPEAGKHVDRDFIILPGINSLSPSSEALRSVDACIAAIGDAVSDQLHNIGVTPPDLAFVTMDDLAA